MNSAPPSTFTRITLALLAFLAIAVLGLVCVVLPVFIANTPLMPAPLFPLLRTAIEHLGWPAIALLTGLGVVGGLAGSLLAGALARSAGLPARSAALSAPLIGLASIAALPVAMFAELIADPTSHNLFPFELIMYALLAIPATLGAVIGCGVRILFRRLNSAGVVQ